MWDWLPLTVLLVKHMVSDNVKGKQNDATWNPTENRPVPGKKRKEEDRRLIVTLFHSTICCTLFLKDPEARSDCMYSCCNICMASVIIMLYATWDVLEIAANIYEHVVTIKKYKRQEELLEKLHWKSFIEEILLKRLYWRIWSSLIH